VGLVPDRDGTAPSHTHVEHQQRALSRQAVPGGGDFGVAAEKIGSGPGA
jgi:hypothetical protein